MVLISLDIFALHDTNFYVSRTIAYEPYHVTTLSVYNFETIQSKFFVYQKLSSLKRKKTENS